MLSYLLYVPVLLCRGSHPAITVDASHSRNRSHQHQPWMARPLLLPKWARNALSTRTLLRNQLIPTWPRGSTARFRKGPGKGSRLRYFGPRQQWYVPAGEETTKFARWLPTNMVYLSCPFDEKDDAKALGARWDPKVRKWYVPADRDPGPFAKWIKVDASASSANGAGSARPATTESTLTSAPQRTIRASDAASSATGRGTAPRLPQAGEQLRAGRPPCTRDAAHHDTADRGSRVFGESTGRTLVQLVVLPPPGRSQRRSR